MVVKKNISEESSFLPSTADNCYAPKWISKYSTPTVKFNGDCLKQDSMSFIHGNEINLINLYISYELDAR